MRSRAHISSHPIHPMLVAFPIGLWITSFALDIIGRALGNTLLHVAGFYALVAGCVMALAAAIPGAIDLLTVVPPNSSGKKRGYTHGLLNVLALLIFAYAAWRRGGALVTPDNVALLMSGLGVGVVLISGWLGATLVYRNQIGIDHRYANAGQWRERTVEGWDQPVCNASELADGQMMLAHISGERIVLGRCGEGYFAFSDHCTHRGGPLSDGALVGCTVQCPWHGSQFDVRSGRVVSGPAEQRIDTYEVELRAGEIYVLPPGRRPAKAA